MRVTTGESSGFDIIDPSQEQRLGAEGDKPSLTSKGRGWIHKAVPLLALLVFCVALYFLHRLLRQHSYHDILNNVRAIPRKQVWAAIGTTVLSYLVLTLYDWIGFEYIGRRLARIQVAFTSFVAYAFGNTIGLANLAAASVRLRLYSSFGLEPVDIVKIVALNSLTFWLGFLAIAGLALATNPLDMPEGYGVTAGTIRWVGITCISLVTGYLVFAGVRRSPLTIRGRTFQVPSLKVSLHQILVASCDWLLAGYTLYLLLPASPHLTYPKFLSVFASAQFIALLAHIPGGVGVLEALVIYFITPDHQANSQVLGALLTYRVIYYLLPFLSAVILLGGYEVAQKRHLVRALSSRALSWTTFLVPNIASLLVFAAGAILLLSGTTPAEHERLNLLTRLLPLPAIELSHFLGSCIGVVLLVLSRALLSRSNAAWLLTMALLGIGAFFSLTKGFDYEEAIVLSIFAAFLYASRDEFHRHAAIFTESFSTSWLIAIGMVVIGATWVGFFAYKHVEFDQDLWWSFSLHGDAPRFLRATVGTFATGIGFGLYRLLAPRPGPRPLPAVSASEIDHIVRDSSESRAHLAELGDKLFFTSEQHDAFLMYGVRGSTWVALGDPIGRPEAYEDLVYDFKEAADQYGSQAVFYQIKPETLPLYIDLGLNFIKLGEEARVNLTHFSLEGGSRKGLRHSYNRFNRETPAEFRVIEPEEIQSLLPQLKTVSDKWLAMKGGKEKGFSLGYYSAGYLARSRTAVLVRQDKVIAFANLWETASKAELSFDLMRFDPECHPGSMEALIINIALWGKQVGYQWLNLGMAPLSGLEPGRMSARWNRAAHLLYEHGQRFYSFEGLRTYKEKFDPQWEPRYLAYPSKLSLPLVLTDITALISKGP